MRIDLVLGFLLGLLFGSAASGGGEPLRELRIEGPSSDEPGGNSPSYTLRWRGGTPPWTVTFDASEPGFDRRQEQIVGSPLGCFGSEPGTCALAPIPVPYDRPQIATITALVRDAAGDSIARQLRVRVASDGPIHVGSGPTVDIRPDDDDVDRFLCRGGADDPPYIGIGGIAAEPVIDFFTDPRLEGPDRLAVVGRDACGFPMGVLYGIADADSRADRGTDLEITLTPPIRYGDYSIPDIRRDRDPPALAPALRALDRYEVQLALPLNCNDPFFTLFQSFALNPPAAGDAVAGSIDPSDCFNDQVPIERSQPIGPGLQFASGRTAFIACVNESFLYGFLARLESLRDAVTFDDDVDEARNRLLFEFFGNPERLDAVRQRCAEEASGTSSKGSAPVEVGIKLIQGRARVTIPAPEFGLELRTERVMIQASTGFDFQIEHEPGGATIVSPIGQVLTVSSLDEGLPTRAVEPGFFIRAGEGGISEPLEDGVFSNSFES